MFLEKLTHSLKVFVVVVCELSFGYNISRKHISTSDLRSINLICVPYVDKLLSSLWPTGIMLKRKIQIVQDVLNPSLISAIMRLTWCRFTTTKLTPRKEFIEQSIKKTFFHFKLIASNVFSMPFLGTVLLHLSTHLHWWKTNLGVCKNWF